MLGASTSHTPARMATANSERLIAFWFRKVMGRVGMISWSLPAAIRLPVKVRKPRITSATRAPMPNAVMRFGVAVRVGSTDRYSAAPTSPAARPPKACDSAVRWGTAVSGTMASGTPSTVPDGKRDDDPVGSCGFPAAAACRRWPPPWPPRRRRRPAGRCWDGSSTSARG